MKKLITSYGLILTIIIIGVLMMIWQSSYPHYQMMHTWPNLPAPIGKERILITLVGQPSEGRIIQRMANQLYLNADYRPRAIDTDVYRYRTIVMVVGHSPLGIYNSSRSLDEEKNRLIGILREAQIRELPVILIHLDGAGRQDSKTLEFIEIAAPYSAYFLGLKSMDNQSAIRKISEDHNIPVTLVNSIKDLATPFNSAFR